MLRKIRLSIIMILLRKEDIIMAEVYATLIIEGVINPRTNEPYTYANTPKAIKLRVKAVLIGLGLDDLVTE